MKIRYVKNCLNKIATINQINKYLSGMILSLELYKKLLSNETTS